MFKIESNMCSLLIWIREIRNSISSCGQIFWGFKSLRLMKNFILKGGNIISSLENEIEKDNKENRQKRENSTRPIFVLRL